MRITTTEAVETIRGPIEDFAAELWDTDEETGRVDWEAWVARLEKTLGIDLPDQWDDPAMVRVKKIARAAINEARMD